MKELFEGIWNMPASDLIRAVSVGLLVGAVLFVGLILKISFRMNMRKRQRHE